MGSEVKLVGTEVPILGSDSVNWIELTVQSSTSPEAADSNAASARGPFAPPTEDCASCSLIGDPPTYVIWYSVAPPSQCSLVKIC